MATELLEKYGNGITAFKLIPGHNGVYNVFKNDALIFSKHDSGRYPELGEIVALLESK